MKNSIVPRVGDYAIVIKPYYWNARFLGKVVKIVGVHNNASVELEQPLGNYNIYRVELIPESIYKSPLFKVINEIEET